MLGTIGDIASAIGDLGRSLGNVASKLNDKEFWIRVGLVVMGLLLIGIALWPHR